MVETMSDARKNLTTHIARFRSEGLDAEPVVFGDHRRPEAALVPYEMFQLLLDVTEDIAIAERLRQRSATETGNRKSLGGVASEFGIDLDEL